MESPGLRPAVSRLRLFVLVVAPALLFCVVGVLTFLTLIAIALFAGWGPSRLTVAAALQVGSVTVMFAFLCSWWLVRGLERGAFGPRESRPPSVRVAPTRLMSAGLVLAIVLGGPPLIREVSFQRMKLEARYGEDEYTRATALGDLAEKRDARALPLVESIATDPAQSQDDRLRAIQALARIPGAKPTLLELAPNGNAAVRKVAAAALVPFIEEPDAWNGVTRAIREDPDPEVRLYTAQALGSSILPEGRKVEAREFLTKLAAIGEPAIAVAAAMYLALDHDTAIPLDRAVAALLDPHNTDATRLSAIDAIRFARNRAALPVLWKIVVGEAALDFTNAGREDVYRNAASQAITDVLGFGADRSEYPNVYGPETAARITVEQVMRAELKYRAETGFFEGQLECLEKPSTCISGHSGPPTFFGPDLRRLLSYPEYVGTLHAGPPAPLDSLRRPGVSPSSVTTFAFVAVPAVPLKTGVRGFCGDDTGRMCFTRDGSQPRVAGGRCPGSSGPSKEYRQGDVFDARLPLECPR